jgi:hypothetical protein
MVIVCLMDVPYIGLVATEFGSKQNRPQDIRSTHGHQAEILQSIFGWPSIRGVDIPEESGDGYGFFDDGMEGDQVLRIWLPPPFHLFNRPGNQGG